MQIIIPTHGRPFKQTTLESLPAELRDETILVVSNQEEAEILKRRHKYVRIAPVKTIADKRQWIMENVIVDKLFMLDDDMYFFGRCPVQYRTYDGRWKLTDDKHKLLSRDYASDTALVGAFAQMSSMLDDVAHVGLSSRMGNDTEEYEWKMNTRMMHAIGYRRDVFHSQKLKFNEVQCREDFNITLRLLRKGFKNQVLYSYCCSPGPYGAKGGAAAERTVALSNQQAMLLEKLHPGLVKTVDKSYDNVPRKEVIVQWKKAYNHDSRK